MSKKEVIKKAWGVYFEHFGEHATKYALENNGYCSVPSFTLGLILRKYGEEWLETDKDLKRRPKSLQGIENNNGWIKIESKDDLPKEEIDVHFIFTEYKGEEGRFQTYGVWDNNLKSFYSGALKINNVTHYQPIIKPKPPIY